MKALDGTHDPARGTLLAAVACLLLGAGGAPRAVHGELVQSGVGRQGVAAEASGSTIRVRLGLDQHRVIPASPGTEVSSLTGNRDGWLLAGAAPLPEGGTELLLLLGNAHGERALAAPPGRVATLRIAPVLLGAPADLAAHRDWSIAWLEGTSPTNLEVRAARWRDGRFERPEVVSPRADGSQLGLVGATLADGSALLVWSAYQAGDTTILSSQRLGQRWTDPEAIAPSNLVPDITPTLIATESGALAAWSQFHDGSYRTVVARFRNGEWGAATPLGNEHRSFPWFVAADSRGDHGSALGRGPLLLSHDALGARWEVLELRPDGTPARRATVSAGGGTVHYSDSRRPLVRSVRGRGVELLIAPAPGSLRQVPSAAAWSPITLRHVVPQRRAVTPRHVVPPRASTTQGARRDLERSPR